MAEHIPAMTSSRAAVERLFFAHSESDIPMKFSNASYAGGIVSICSAITLSEAGVIIGIITAVLTCIANLIHASRKDRREQRESDARIARLVTMKAEEVVS